MEQILASRRRRIFAFIIDHILISGLAVIGCLAAMGKHWDLASPERMMGIILPAMLVVFVVYVLKDSIRGMSPGRFILGIAVRNLADPERIPIISQLFVRNLTIIIWPIEFFVLGFSKQKRRLGDRIAKTIVIRREDITRGTRVLSFVILILGFGLLFVCSMGAIVKTSSAYEHAIVHIEASHEVNAAVGNIVGYGVVPMGGIQVQNQYGYAQLKIKINGDKNSIAAVVTLQKEPDTDWQLKALKLIE
jgi:uncharacterized RDD family membrane protein YckC